MSAIVDCVFKKTQKQAATPTTVKKKMKSKNANTGHDVRKLWA